MKTRLCPPLGLELAARLARAFLADVLEAARSVDPNAAFLTPASDADELRRHFPDAPIIVQHGVGLPAALEGAVRDGAILLSGDAPTYPPSLIRQGVESTADLVIGPSLDGGYCLIGMRRFHPAPFQNIAWSTAAVLNQTTNAARVAGLSVDVLAPHQDVDTIDDLLALDLTHAPATAALLADPDAVAVTPRRPPQVVGCDIRFTSPWRTFIIDELSHGRRYSYLDVPPAVWVVPVTDLGATVLVRQYRHPARAYTLETPAGSINPDEHPSTAAARELREEVGGVARELQRVGGFYSSSAHISLRGLVFLATGVEFGTPTHAHHEGIELVHMPLDRAVDLAQRGELCEAQSALALIYAARALDLTGSKWAWD